MTRLQTEGHNKCSSQIEKIWTQLHGNILNRGHLVLYQTDSDPLSHQVIAYSTS